MMESLFGQVGVKWSLTNHICFKETQGDKIEQGVQWQTKADAHLSYGLCMILQM